jgi:hypothetical protein
MRVYAISDLHLSNDCDKPMDVFGGNWEGYTTKIQENWSKSVKADDIVLIPGDISWAMKLEEAKKDLEWIDKLPGTKIMIKGNHEYWWKSISAVRSILPESIKAIQNDAIKLGKFVFCGTRGWTVPDPNDKDYTAEDLKIFKREVERLKLTLMSAKVLKSQGDKVIAMIHYPPFDANKGDSEFTQLFEEYEVDIVVFGHIHGYTNCPLFYEKNNVKYYFTSCDHINNNPVLLEEK